MVSGRHDTAPAGGLVAEGTVVGAAVAGVEVSAGAVLAVVVGAGVVGTTTVVVGEDGVTVVEIVLLVPDGPLVAEEPQPFAPIVANTIKTTPTIRSPRLISPPSIANQLD